MHKVSYGRYKKAVNHALANVAKAHHLRTESKHPYVLSSRENWHENLWEPLQEHCKGNDDWLRRADRQRWIHNLRSSQTFALNLFGPLKLKLPWAQSAWDCFPDFKSLSFEFPKDDDLLEEATGARKSRTRIDVCVEYGGGCQTALVEVKLTERDFGDCKIGHQKMKRSELNAFCKQPFQSFATSSKGCYLHKEAKRNYFTMLARSDSLVDEERMRQIGHESCPIRDGFYQIARNLLMVQHLREKGTSKDCKFVLIAPGPKLNPFLHSIGDLSGHLRAILKPSEVEAIQFIDFTKIVNNAANFENQESARSWVAYMREKYVEPLKLGSESSVNIT